MNRFAAVIWWVMLIATYFAVVPVVLFLLRRVLKASRNIEQYTAEMLTSGVGVANNTASVAALKDTLAVAPQLVGGAESLAYYAERIETALRSKNADNGRAQKRKGV